jgi:hypothetical protein
MRLHDESVGIGGEEGLYRKHVVRRLEHEAARGATILQMLKKVSVELVDGSHVLSF